MNRQKIFDKVAEHLLTQGVRSENIHGCKYRTKQGLKCAIGCLIPKEIYTEDFEDISIEDIFHGCMGFRATLPDDTQSNLDTLDTYLEKVKKLKTCLEINNEETESYDINFLTQLQRIHDCRQPVAWRDALLKFAENEHLTTGVLNAFNPRI